MDQAIGKKQAEVPNYMKETIAFRVSVKGYKFTPKEKEWRAKVFAAGDKFFKLLKFKLWDPDSMTYKKEVGVDLSMKDKHRWTALHWAANNDTTPPEVFKMLLEEGCDPNALTVDGKSAMCFYLTKHRHTVVDSAILNLFLEHRFNIDLIDKNDFAIYFHREKLTH